MIYTEMTKKALKLCFDAHKDQIDKSGMPYVFHPFHLAEQMETEETVTVALLHDVVEDSDYTLSDLEAMGFPTQVVEAVGLMTHEKDVSYMDYVAQIGQNPIARTVKLADLKHNIDPTRLDVIDEYAEKRAAKYLQAILYLNDLEFNSLPEIKKMLEEAEEEKKHLIMDDFGIPLLSTMERKNEHN